MHVRVVWQIKEIATCTEEQTSLADCQVILEAHLKLSSLNKIGGLRCKCNATCCWISPSKNMCEHQMILENNVL